MKNPPLTKRQRQILDFYGRYSAEHGISPTLEEVALHFGVNKVTIFGHVAELERKGVIQRAARGISRGLRLVTEPAERSADEALDRGSVMILGSIAAGGPIEAIENPEPLALDSLIPTDRDVYALRVRGDSMIDDGVHDGDIVILERRQDARDGDMVVAVLPDEQTTLKRLFKEHRGWRLQPANPSMKPIHADQVEVRGVVIGVLRRY